MLALLKIEWLRMSRNKKYIFITVATPILFFLVFSSMMKFNSKKQEAEFLMSMTTFCLTTFGLFNFPFDIMEDRTNGWDQTLKKVPLTRFQVTIVKIIKMTIESAISIILVFFTGFLVKNVTLSLYQWIVSGILLLCGSTIFLSIGTLLTLFKNMQTASLFSNVLYFGLAILGGLWFPIDQFPEWIRKIGKMTPTYSFRELAVYFIQKGRISITSVIIMLCYGALFILGYWFLSKHIFNENN